MCTFVHSGAVTNPRISGLLMGTGGGNGWGRYIFYLNCLVPGLLKDHKAVSQNRAAPLEERREGVMKLKFSELGLLWEQNIINMSFVSGYVGSSVHGILQARTLQWVAIPFSRRSSRPKNWTRISCIAGRFFTIWATREVPCNYLGREDLVC